MYNNFFPRAFISVEIFCTCNSHSTNLIPVIESRLSRARKETLGSYSFPPCYYIHRRCGPTRRLPLVPCLSLTSHSMFGPQKAIVSIRRSVEPSPAKHPISPLSLIICSIRCPMPDAFRTCATAARRRTRSGFGREYRPSCATKVTIRDVGKFPNNMVGKPGKVRIRYVLIVS